jgi:hypothetical protein
MPHRSHLSLRFGYFSAIDAYSLRTLFKPRDARSAVERVRSRSHANCRPRRQGNKANDGARSRIRPVFRSINASCSRRISLRCFQAPRDTRSLLVTLRLSRFGFPRPSQPLGLSLQLCPLSFFLVHRFFPFMRCTSAARVAEPLDRSLRGTRKRNGNHYLPRCCVRPNTVARAVT